ncbi:type II secretion system F family protein [Mycobacterium asiaticum]|uniref:Uncharacterized protein n=1 Tax=Mycobacterium asiaticum TaxID=1790 RepID=A0A1A3NAZ8_MYCAS|nr:type II secretion system F family protein [Mycobacterium asiaticum]OBK19338.1 hypothetical protein A5636_18195 [Mycobacterium asiaticum]
MSPVSALVTQVEERVRRDPGFAKLLDALLDVPTVPLAELERVAARKLNNERRDGMMSDFRTGAIPTREVQSRLGYETPQAVHELRRRGKVLGLTVGNNTWFPAWQFHEGRLRPDLPEILELLARFTSDPVVADRIMRIKRDELDGASISEALRRKKTADTAWQLLTAVGA